MCLLKKKNTNNKIKYYLCGVQVAKKKCTNNSVRQYLLGIPVIKTVWDKQRLKTYVFGIKVSNINLDRVVQAENTQEIQKSLLRLQSMQLLQKRRDINFGDKI